MVQVTYTLSYKFNNNVLNGFTYSLLFNSNQTDSYMCISLILDLVSVTS